MSSHGGGNCNMSSNWEQWLWPANSKHGAIAGTQHLSQARPPFRASWTGANMGIMSRTPYKARVIATRCECPRVNHKQLCYLIYHGSWWDNLNICSKPGTSRQCLCVLQLHKLNIRRALNLFVDYPMYLQFCTDSSEAKPSVHGCFGLRRRDNIYSSVCLPHRLPKGVWF